MKQSFDEYRLRNNSAIAEREEVIREAQSITESGEQGSARKNALARIRYSRSRINDVLLEDRIRIEGLASTQDQREEYGIERWHAQFVRLRDIDAQERMRVWSAVPHSRFKRFQQAFSHAHQFIVPPYEARGSHIVFPASFDFDTADIAPCLVAGDRIPDKLASDLALVEFEEDDSPFDRLEKKSSVAVADRLKEIWQSATLLRRGNLRILRLSEQAGDAAGSLLYLRESVSAAAQDSSEYPTKQLTVQYFDSAYAALRKTDHESHAHWAEMNTLIDLDLELEDLNNVLSTRWKRHTLDNVKRSVREEVEARILRCVEQLRLCCNQNKVEASDILAETADIRDSLGRLNPSATMAKLLRCSRLLRQRFEQIDPIGACNQADKIVLRQAVSTQERRLDSYDASMHSMRDDSQFYGMLLGNGDYSDLEIETDTDTHLQKWNVTEQALAGVSLKPLSEYAKKLSAQLPRFRQALIERERAGYMREYFRMRTTSRLRMLHTDMETMKLRLGSPEITDIAFLRSVLAPYRETFEALSSDEIEFHCRQVGNEASELLRIIDERLRFYQSRSLSSEQTAAMYERLKGHLDSIDIPSLLRHLP